MAGKAERELVAGRQHRDGGTRGQKRKVREDGWTVEKVQAFFAALADSCNASEAAREAGVCRASAYRRRKLDAGFAEAWDDALEEGYGEIELMLMREALHGTEVEEVVLDGEGAVKTRKVKRVRNLAVALRLFALHRERMEKRRAAREAIGRPDSADAIARVEAVLGEIGWRREMAGV